MESQERELDLSDLISIYRLSKKTIQEYVREIERYCRYKSIRGMVKDGTAIDDRGKLIDLYESCLIQDAHLASTLQTLESQILGERYMLARITDKGKYIKDVDETKKIQGTQFTKIIKGIAESKLFGYTGIEIMPDIDPINGRLKEVNLIERRNILPDQNRIVLHQGIWSPGWDLGSSQYIKNYVIINSGDLGLFAASTPMVLAKKFTLANYVNFGHTYGQPIIHGKTDSADTNDRKRLANDIANAAQKKVIVTGLTDEVDIKTFTMSNSEKIYTSLIGLSNQEVSNLILGSESMAGGMQSYVGSTEAHASIFRDRVDVYHEYIENVMNEQIIPRLVRMGFLKPGLYFKYANRLEMSNKDKIELYQFLTDRYEVAPDEIEKEFGVVVGKQINLNKNGASVLPGPDDGTYTRRMSDEEYYRRYGRYRDAVNFLKERGI